MRARNVCVASVDLFSQNSAVATAAREDGIQCVTLLTYLAAAQIYRTNRSRHYRVMVLDNAHHSTPAGVSCSAADGVRDLDLAKASVDTDSSTHKKHVASDLLEQNQLTLLNIWVRLGHDSNTASQEAKYLEGDSSKKLDIRKLSKLFQLV
ncbi:uncharacterized protein [Zea mays]|uniref:uncharacterized protein isoform X2 n=1 Tax=Zea mays TaxID=4577 RepID=UPI000C6C3BB7|nr:uncharacterized protein LOC100277351 isoform X2 [Zea mays]|eukprot:XP_023157628.1 uncharacterized protein LOC100277351 isoform X2 [Zea mays]